MASTRTHWPTPPAWFRKDLACIEWAESRNTDDRTNAYSRGYFQFEYGYNGSSHTWQSVGGTGDPADASFAEQRYRAWLLEQRDGWSQWSTAAGCGL